MFDLNLYPLFFKDGIEQSDLPGLYVSTAPRRPARGRSGDTLIIFLTLLGSAPGTSAGYQPLFERLEKTFFNSSGAVTSALRAAAEDLNQILLDRNLKNTQSGKQSIGWITFVAIHSGVMTIAQSGPTHTFVLGSGQVLHYYEAQLAGRGLGLSRTTTLRYFQSQIEAGDWLAFSAEPPTTWNEKTLIGSTVLSTEQLRRRLMNQAQRNLRAGLVQFQNGTGKVSMQHFPPDRVDWINPPPVETKEPPAHTEAPTAVQPAPAPTAVPAAPVPHAETPAAVSEAPVPDAETPAAAAPAEPVEAPSTETPPVEEPAENPAPTASVETAEANEAATEDVLPAPKSAEGEIEPSAAEETAPWENPPAAAGSTTSSASEGTPAHAAIPTPPRISVSSLERFRNLTNPSAEPAAPEPEPEAESAPQPAVETPPPAPVVEHPAAKPLPGKPARPPREHRSRVEWERKLAQFWRSGGKAGKQGSSGLKTFISRILPDHKESEPLLTKGQMIVVAIAVPLVIVTIALTAYFEVGRSRQAKTYYLQALQAAQATLNTTDPTVLRDAWSQTLVLLDQADANGVTDESRTLRIQAQDNLDDLENIRRMDYETAIVGGLSPTVKISQIVTTSSDMYLLDSVQGRVLHAVLTGQGYEVDPNFQCGPGSTGNLIIGPLVDITAMPRSNDFSADILAIDATGNVLYCAADADPQSATLTTPDSGWSKITSITIDGNQLYVLDPGVNAVWIYDGVINGFTEAPRLIFGDEIPPMTDVIDVGINNQYLYLLHGDGHATLCTFSPAGYEPTRCTDPAPYGDSRPGRDANPVAFPDAIFSQVVSTALPTPSLYLLAPDSRSIYLFSVQLKLQNQYRAQSVTDVPLPDQPATAFYVSANRIAYLAVGNQIYQALMP
ncbi:MAG: hypothetical protein ABFD44_12780 [Anaerolineaceae bacterium]